MLRFRVRPFDRDHWTDLAAEYTDYSLVQTWEWGEAKSRIGPWRVERGVIVDEDDPDSPRILGLAQVLLRPLPLGLPGGLAWINRAPMGDQDGRAAAVVARYYARDRHCYVRLAPAGTEPVMADGLALAGTAGWASARLDLEPAPETLRRGLKQKWRNGLNKAIRLGLEVEHGDNETLFSAFLDHHDRFARERGFASTVTGLLLRTLQDLLRPEQPMITFIARHDGVMVGGALLIRYGSTCEYLAGNATEAGRRANAGQLLLWRAIEVMRDAGCRILDLGGMDPDLTPEGIYRFKDGLGAVPYRLAPELEAVGGGPLGWLVRHRVRTARASS